MPHVLHYAMKSARATGQLAAALVLGLLAVLLLFSTVVRWRFESALRDAIQLAATNDGEPLALLEEARAARPDDLLPQLVTGQVLLEKGLRQAQDAEAKGDTSPDSLALAKKTLEGAVRAFDRACDKREKFAGASSESAPVGACYARLALGDVSPPDRQNQIEEAAKALDRARDKDDVDVVVAQACVSWARADAAACSKFLGDASTKLSNASRGALGAYYWHRGLCELLAKDPQALDDLRRASNFYSSPRVGKMVGLALRIAAADPAWAPKDKKELEARLAQLQDTVGQRTRNGHRDGLEKIDEAAAWNALGVGWSRVPNGEKAYFCFARAGSMKNDILYKVNGALSIRLKAEGPLAPNETAEQARRRCDVECAGSLVDVISHYDAKNDPQAQGREKFCREALLAAAGLAYQGGKGSNDAASPVNLAHEKFGLEDPEYWRDIGCLQDAAHRLDLASSYYKKAIAAGHKDSYKMQERIDLFERGKR